MRSVAGAESVVNIEVCKRSKLLGKLGIVLCFARLEADIFKKENFAVFKRSCKLVCAFADNILCELYFHAEVL